MSSTSSGEPEASSLAEIEADQAVGKSVYEVEIVLHDEHRQAQLRANPRQHLGQSLGLPLGDSRGRLIEQQQRRSVGDCASQLDDSTSPRRKAR